MAISAYHEVSFLNDKLISVKFHSATTSFTNENVKNVKNINYLALNRQLGFRTIVKR